MKPKHTIRKPLVGTHVACIAMLVLWQSALPFVRADISNDEATVIAPPLLRSASNITTNGIPHSNQCSNECVIGEIETGGCLGFAGDDCSFPFVVCPDSVTQCFGPLATCVDQSDSPNARDYKCDCRASSASEIDSITATMQESRLQDCRDIVTEVCEKDKTVSVDAFCTNGGKCVDQIQEGEPHPGCFCPGRFVGRHCEKRRGTGTDYRFDESNANEEPIQKNQGITGNSNIGRTSMSSTLVVLLSVGISGFLVYAAVLYKKFLSNRDGANPAEDDVVEKNIDVPPGVNDNDSELEVL